jgi:parvulin-like peptidyl-prolyl isomerase
MSVVLEVDNQAYTAEDLVPLLAQYQLLPKLAQEIITDKAIANIKCSEEENNSIFNQFCQQNQLDSEEQIQEWLNKQGMNREQLQNLITKKLRLDKYKQETWNDQVDAHFIKRKSQLDRVVYSLIRVEKPEVAQELFFRVKDDQNAFSALAMEYSQGTEAQTGGIIGPVEINAPHPKIAQILTTCQPGQLVPPTRVGEWIVIVRLENYISAKLDQPMRQRMLDELFNRWLSDSIQQKVSFLPSPVTS